MISQSQRARLTEYLADAFPEGVKILVIDDGADLYAIRMQGKLEDVGGSSQRTVEAHS